MPQTLRAPRRRTQHERSASMQQRLIAASVESLVAVGYANTTEIEVCRRAGVTRGALLHHFASLSALLAAALEALYRSLPPTLDGTASRARRQRPASADWITKAWKNVSRPEFKAVIEIWLAARNDAALRREIAPVIARYGDLFTPERNADLAARLGGAPRANAFFHLALEAMLGMALGRAMSPEGAPMGHEEAVIRLLRSLAEGPARARHRTPKEG